MKVIFSNSLPEDYIGAYFSYTHQNFGRTNRAYLDARAYIHSNQHLFISALEEWHSSVNVLASGMVKNWWISPASRQLSWFPSVFQALFFSVAVCEIMRKSNIETIYILNSPPEVESFLLEFIPDSKFDRENQLKAPSGDILRNMLKNYYLFFRSHLRGFFNRLPKIKTTELIVFSQVLNEEKIKQRYDHYFGDLFFKTKVENRKKTHWLFFYPANKSAVKREICRVFEQTNTSVSFTSDYIGLLDILKILARSITHKFQLIRLSRLLPPISIFNYKSLHFISIYKREILFTGQEILSELEVGRAFEKITVQGQLRKVLYPYEERSVERAILTNIPRDVVTFGFVHAAMHQGHICFNMAPKSRINPPRPQEILVTGSAPREWFINKGHDPSHIKVMGSPRANLEPLAKTVESRFLRILVMVSHPDELQMLTSLVEKDPSIISRHQLTIRKYPYWGIREQNHWIQRLSSYIPQLKDEAGDLPKQIQEHDVVIFSTSSGGIEAILLGAIGLHVCLDNIFLLNVVEILKEQKVIPQAFSIKDINRYLLFVESLDSTARKELHLKQVDMVQHIYQKANVDFLFER